LPKSKGVVEPEKAYSAQGISLTTSEKINEVER
jgi:hypothetical protein